MASAAERRPEVEAWQGLVEALRHAGEQLAISTADLAPADQSNGFQALVRALANQLGRFDVDRELPEFTAFNGWRQKFLMDNPDFRYWSADVRSDRRYRVTGNLGDADYLSLTAYAAGGGVAARAVARTDSDTITFSHTGDFSIVVGGTEPDGDWLDLPEGAGVLWLRFFHNDASTDQLGWCHIAPLDEPRMPGPADPARLGARIDRLSGMMAMMPTVFEVAARRDLLEPNEIGPWSEMTGGAVYTEPGIEYLRGGWRLAPGEALLIEGRVPPCRYWNVMAYNRYLNSLDYRYRRVSYTGGTATIADGRYRFVLSADPPPPGSGDWIDSEGRESGILVFRFLQPDSPPEPPTVRVLASPESAVR